MKPTPPEKTPAVDLAVPQDIIAREAAALGHMGSILDERFIEAAKRIYHCTGSVVLSGIGKAGIVAQKISATLGSTGTPSHFLHAAEAVHGDLGRLRDGDLAIVLSHSGKSPEITRLIALLKQLSISMIAITGDETSPLARHAEITLHLGDIEEVCPLGLAPSASTTCMLAMGDALALTVMQMRNFKREDYARYHPGGELGRQLVTVEQAAFFTRGEALPTAAVSDTLHDALDTLATHAGKRPGCVLVVAQDGTLAGIVTDGDIRRTLLKRGKAAGDAPLGEIMTAKPKTVQPDTLASEAMAIFHEYRIDEIPVIDDHRKPVGLIDVQDVLALKLLQ